MREINYDIIPEHCRGGMRRYIEEGVPAGDFLTAILENNLVEAYARADNINERRIRDYAKFLYCEVPTECWGSKKKVEAWLERYRVIREVEKKKREEKQ